MKRWDWTWEEPRPRGRSEQQSRPIAPPGVARPAHAPLRAFRRRRRAAAAGLVAILALLILAITSHGKGRAGPSPTGSHPATRQAVPARLSAAEGNALSDQSQNRAVDRVLSYTPVVTEGGSKGDEVALTFDDGPGPYTERLVGALNRLHVRATFFQVGEEERYFSGGTLLELRSGDVVGDHTETHPMMARLSRHDQHEELFEQIARIELLGGPRPRLFRPPYGSFNATTFKELRAMRLLMVLWSTDTRDFALPGVQAIVQSALAGAHPGAIILMHDAGGDRSETVAALPAIVAGLRARGLRPVTIPRLMLDDPPPAGRPIPTSLAGD